MVHAVRRGFKIANLLDKNPLMCNIPLALDRTSLEGNFDNARVRFDRNLDWTIGLGCVDDCEVQETRFETVRGENRINSVGLSAIF